MTIGFLATGDEITQGDTLNTNSQAMAHVLNSQGFILGFHLSCRDNEKDIQTCLAFLSQMHDIIIVTGGLGPTSDDKTRFALARFLDSPLVESPIALAHVKARLDRASLECNQGNRQQALFPEGARLLDNPNGTAMGCYYEKDQKIYILLPGPPRECLPIFMKQLLPLLEPSKNQEGELLKWLLFGVSEGEMAERLEAALSGIDCATGYRLDMPYLEFKVRCHQTDVERVRQIVRPIIEPHIIASPNKKASEVLRLALEKRQERVTIIDKVTGGILQTLLQRPENYHFLTFNPEGESTISFHIEGLDDYWLNPLTKRLSTTITITYESQGQRVSESDEIPFRSNLVVFYAAEWLCFRLLHLINQLH